MIQPGPPTFIAEILFILFILHQRQLILLVRQQRRPLAHPPSIGVLHQRRQAVIVLWRVIIIVHRMLWHRRRPALPGARGRSAAAPACSAEPTVLS